MALPARQQLIYWGLATAVFFVLLWYLGNVLLPFVVGGAIAYLLDPLADRLEAIGIPRVFATTIIMVFGFFIIIAAVVLVIPLLVDQAQALMAFAPELISLFREYLTTRFPDLMDESSTLRQSLSSLSTVVQSNGGALFEQLVGSVTSVLSAVVFIVVVPVVTFYLLLDWDKMIADIDQLLPRDHAPTIRKLAHEVDKTLASFVRGQLTVVAILGTFYATALMIVGLNFGFIVGAIAGLISFIPYLGALIGGALAIGLALFQFWGDPIWIVVVAAIFFGGQMVEGNVLTPLLVGNSVGLHPVWLLLALSVFGTIYGFIGLLVAVPIAAVLGVMVRFLIAEYRVSLLYLGLSYQRETERSD